MSIELRSVKFDGISYVSRLTYTEVFIPLNSEEQLAFETACYQREMQSKKALADAELIEISNKIMAQESWL